MRSSPTRCPLRPLLVEALEDRLAPATFTVTNTNDSGAGSLRASIGSANAAAGADTIAFNIGSGLQNIDILSALPAIAGKLTIDGTTQPGFATTPIIELNGSAAGASINGLVLNASGSVIRGLVINRFEGDAIRIRANNCRVEGCFIGTDPTGLAAPGNGRHGVFITGGVSGNVVGGTAVGTGNLISGNGTILVNGIPFASGVRISGVGTTGNKVQGNFIGTDLTTAVDLGNALDGVLITGGASGNLIGGATPGAGNVISGNGEVLGNDLRISGVGTLGNKVQGNFIGTDKSGTAALPSGHGLQIERGATGNVVGGTTTGARNVISGGSVLILDQGTNGNVVQGNFIGTDVTGTSILGNAGTGINISGGASGNVVGGAAAGAGNVISGQSLWGVVIHSAGTTGNRVQGNLIGTDVTGTVALGNGNGVRITGSADNNLIGGTTPGTRNVISGNNVGVFIDDTGTTGNRVQGNYIGTDVTGVLDLGNTLDGVFIINAAVGTVIGGTTPGAGNVISGNGRYGVISSGFGTAGTQVLGNYIGTELTGTIDLGNTAGGVLLTEGSPNSVVGGTVAGARNVISGNDGDGVLISGTTGAKVRGNFIGTDKTGTADLGNSLNGIRIDSSAHNSVIGGTVAGSRNIISGNDQNGIAILDAGTKGNKVLGNRIFANGGLGIDMNADGVTANDLDDADTGANDLLNFPVLTTVRLTATGDLRIIGSINTESNKTLRIEFFANTAPDGSGFGEGQRYLGFVLVQTLGGHTANFSTLLDVAGLQPGQFVTATATDQVGNTSEFSLGLAVI